MSINPEVVTNFDGGSIAIRSKEVTTEMAIARQAQEVQAAMVIAKKFPRDEIESYNRIMKACERPSLAEQAEYTFPRGGETVNGPSIRLAEVLARCWGNIDFGITELEQRPGESTMMAYAWDLETNTRQSRIFTQKHERRTKRAGIVKLDDPRDIYELTANNGARRVRACILGIIPGDVVDAAVAKCRETLKKGGGKPLEDKVRDMIVAFSKLGVTKEMMEKRAGMSADSFTAKEVREFATIYYALVDNVAKRDDFFDIPKPKSSLEGEFNEQTPPATDLFPGGEN
jgi:hypothetical protein